MMLYYSKEDRDINIKTKKSHMYFSFYHWWFQWALPLQITIEVCEKGYFEIFISLLCGTFTFTRITHKKSKKLDDYYKGMKNEKN